MFKEFFRQGAPFPTNREEGVTYTEELADGIKLWAKIDIVVVPFVILLWALGVIPVILLGLAVLLVVVVGCPIIIVLGFSIGCLRYLKARECYEIVKRRLRLADA